MSEINMIAIIIPIVIGCPLTSLGAPSPVVIKSLLFLYLLRVNECYMFRYYLLYVPLSFF